MNRQFLQKVLPETSHLLVGIILKFEQDNLDEASLIARFGPEAMADIDVLEKRLEESLTTMKQVEQSLQAVCVEV